MMFVGTPLGSNSASPIPAHSPGPDRQSEVSCPALLPRSPPCWASQARGDLAQAEAELRRLHEKHSVETESVKRGVERSILGARREERRLLERVEQDHRDTQQGLEQVQRENMAAARVSQSLLDQRLRMVAQLKQRIQVVSQQSGLEDSEPNQLLKDIAEFLQPWEVSVSLKKVNFKPSSQPNAVTFGDIHVQEQSLCLHVGGCGPQGHMCALHSQEMQCDNKDHQGAGGENITLGQGWTSPTGRVVRKISLSTRSDLESEEEQNLSTTKIGHWLPKCEQPDWESSQDEEMEQASCQPQGEDVFLAVPTLLKNMDTESKDQVYKMNSNGKHHSPRNPRKSITGVSGRKPSPSPERRREHAKLNHCLSLDSQGGDSHNRHLRYGNSALTSSRLTPRESLASQSCLDLTSRGRPHSRLSQSSDEHSLGTHGDSGRAPSPTDSLDSSYTFIVSPLNDYSKNRGSLNYNSRLSKSSVDLTHKTRPMISGGTNEHEGLWSVKCSNFNSMSSSTSHPLNRGPTVSDMGQTFSYPSYRSHNILHQPQKKFKVTGSKQPLVSRSLSMSVIDGSSQEQMRGRGEPALMEMEEEGDSSLAVLNPRGIDLIRQFGKQGSGRSDLTLPSGIHATQQGQLFIVDCGNARIQVTDPRGNVLQQVTSPTSDGSARRCRNYFDIAVNAKGLIALSCAAERALLVFSRHGRLLQTFGGSGSGSARDELEAPRGVTVTRQDEFLIADIRRGSLIALKLDPKTGSRLERTVVTGFHRPYLVAACSSSGMVAVSERGNETGHVPCIKVLEPGWNTVRVLGVCAGMGPVLVCPWGISIDTDGNVLVADWGEQHRVLLYPAQGVGWPIVTQGLSSPRGLTLLPEGHLAVSDSMHHCIKIYQYKGTH
ncbi:hypothetical protein OYC64_018836 [Pagothenia borchgrevinki]|uniref:E3 ubiquitin-protein ligase TRIM32 n=1 Tax=Pagothenia borchgrevinki TaxID=8213 RepID=A0ABD2GRA7_PAGBO